MFGLDIEPSPNYFRLQIQILNFSPLEIDDFAYSSYFPECLTTGAINWAQNCPKFSQLNFSCYNEG